MVLLSFDLEGVEKYLRIAGDAIITFRMHRNMRALYQAERA